MKRILKTLTFAAVISAALTSCGGGGSSSSTTVAPSLSWSENPSFDSYEILSTMNTSINVSAPGKIENLNVKLSVPDDAYIALLNSYIGVSTNKTTAAKKDATFDLVNDTQAASALGVSSPYGKTSVTINLNTLLQNLTSSFEPEKQVKFTGSVNVTDQTGKSTSKNLIFTYTPGPTVSWNKNEDWETFNFMRSADFTKNYYFTVSAPAGITSFTITADSPYDGFKTYLQSLIGISDNKSKCLMDLVNDKSLLTSVSGLVSNTSVSEATSLKVNLGQFLDYIKTYADYDSTHKFVFSIVDANGRTYDRTATYKLVEKVK